ncbi:MAG TPA: ion channel [Stellaceae bacterium]|jgi:inward rectifier potassium channel|nr:ion channel [Stellaceae bacterium]
MRLIWRPTRSTEGVRRVGSARITRHDAYHLLLTMPWRWFFGIQAAAYVLFNAVFALLYLVAPGSIANAKPGSFTDAFFFSVQTMATIGFGVMAPATFYANVMVTIEALLGMASVAVAAGLIFARFSQPTARVLFSNVAVVTPFNGVPTLMFRCANERRNQIFEAQVHVDFARQETSAEGMDLRRSYELDLARNRNPQFSLSWTVMHPIDAESPLYGIDPDLLAGQEASIVVTLTGIDETISQRVFARTAYRADEILWGRKFVDILSETENGDTLVDYRRFHDTVEGAG